MCYNACINKFYTSGFLYNFKTQQILLLQAKDQDEPASWTMWGGECSSEEETRETFLRIINQSLNLNLKNKDVFPVYDYFHQKLDKTNFVFYAQTGKKLGANWLTFAQTAKLIPQTDIKKDLVIAQRVIELKQRVDQNLQ